MPQILLVILLIIVVPWVIAAVVWLVQWIGASWFALGLASISNAVFCLFNTYCFDVSSCCGDILGKLDCGTKLFYFAKN